MSGSTQVEDVALKRTPMCLVECREKVVALELFDRLELALAEQANERDGVAIRKLVGGVGGSESRRCWCGGSRWHGRLEKQRKRKEKVRKRQQW